MLFRSIIIATKLDKINRSQVPKHIKMLREGLHVKPGTKVFPYSALTKQGRDEIWDFIDEMLGFQEESQEKLTKKATDPAKEEKDLSENSDCEENPADMQGNDSSKMQENNLSERKDGKPAKVKIRKKHIKKQEKKSGKKREKKRGKK